MIAALRDICELETRPTHQAKYLIAIASVQRDMLNDFVAARASLAEAKQLNPEEDLREQYDQLELAVRAERSSLSTPAVILAIGLLLVVGLLLGVR